MCLVQWVTSHKLHPGLFLGRCGLFTKISLSSKLILCLLCMTYNFSHCIQCHIQQYTNLYTVYSAIYSNTRIYIQDITQDHSTLYFMLSWGVGVSFIEYNIAQYTITHWIIIWWYVVCMLQWLWWVLRCSCSETEWLAGTAASKEHVRL